MGENAYMTISLSFADRYEYERRKNGTNYSRRKDQ